jgi:type II secretory pathway pseudopilin PulG
MMYLSIALVIIAIIAGYLVNRWLDQRQQELDRTITLNNEAAEAALSAAMSEMHKQFDTRINKTWETISTTKQELESLKLQLAIKGRS